ncbi:MAG TPA: hypothetical protein VGB92_26395 [Longimicrobium sp.]|jgi:hypothetical protein
MTDFWKSEEAETRFGEVMHRALTNAPQTVLGPDRTAVVVISDADHYRLVLAHQRLIQLGETPPVPHQLQEGEQSAWECLQSLTPVQADDDEFDFSEFLERIKEEERHCACCVRRTETGRAADAERGVQVLDPAVQPKDA